MRAVSFLGFLILATTACTSVSGDDVTTSSDQTTATITAPSTTEAQLVPGCVTEADFKEGGIVAAFEPLSSDTHTIGLISWEATQSCETFTFSFVTSEGAPATTPPSITVEYVEEAPILRVHVDTESTVLGDQLVETNLVDRLYVVRSLDGGMYVDLHLAAPAQAAARAQSSPAQLTLDLQPGIVELAAGSANSDRVVLVAPEDGADHPTPVAISGYARTFESNVMIIATAGDRVIAEESTTAADSNLTWGEFRADLDLPAGEVLVFVGEASAEDGSLEGVTINLTVR